MTTNNNNNTVPSIYIHRAHYACADPELFRNTFNRVLGADCVRSVDLVKKTDKNEVPFIRAFIHFKFWPRGETADRMYNDLMTEKRSEITYDQDTKWFWRFCRSKLPARDDPSHKNKRKPRYGDGDKKKTTAKPPSEGDVLPVPVLKRGANGYKETSQRRVSNEPAWMADGTRPTPTITVADFIPTEDGGDASSDDGEFVDYVIPKVSETMLKEQDEKFGGKRHIKEDAVMEEVEDDGSCGV